MKVFSRYTAVAFFGLLSASLVQSKKYENISQRNLRKLEEADLSDVPSQIPSSTPTSLPTSIPSSGPSITESLSPSSGPSITESLSPSSGPSVTASLSPSSTPSTNMPTETESITPSAGASLTPSGAPSISASSKPSVMSDFPSSSPSLSSSSLPSSFPSSTETSSPSVSSSPSSSSSSSPSSVPSVTPVAEASMLPTATPSESGSEDSDDEYDTDDEYDSDDEEDPNNSVATLSSGEIALVTISGLLGFCAIILIGAKVCKKRTAASSEDDVQPPGTDPAVMSPRNLPLSPIAPVSEPEPEDSNNDVETRDVANDSVAAVENPIDLSILTTGSGHVLEDVDNDPQFSIADEESGIESDSMLSFDVYSTASGDEPSNDMIVVPKGSPGPRSKPTSILVETEENPEGEEKGDPIPSFRKSSSIVSGDIDEHTDL